MGMKIWIDGKEANVANRVGSGQYAYEILRNLEKIDQENEYTIFLPNPPLADLPSERKNWQYRILKPSKLWTRIGLPAALYLGRSKPNVFFTPSHYIPRFSPVKRVCAIFDLSFLHFPEMFNGKDLWQLKLWTKYSIENADHLLAISEFTKQDIIKNYQVIPSRITVTPLGYNKDTFKPVKDKDTLKKVLRKYRTGDNYIIYIGTIQPRKNLIRLMEAFAGITSEPDLKLVIVGKTTEAGRKGWKYQEILETPKRLGIEEKIKFIGFVPTEELPFLLSGAKIFVLPSLWEGFGIPVLEAMATGVVVATSDISSLPEVAGAAGTFFDPYSVEGIQNALENLLENRDLREKKVQLGLEQAEKFSWESCANKTLKVLKNV